MPEQLVKHKRGHPFIDPQKRRKHVDITLSPESIAYVNSRSKNRSRYIESLIKKDQVIQFLLQSPTDRKGE
jgi:hypothetical protein